MSFWMRLQIDELFLPLRDLTFKSVFGSYFLVFVLFVYRQYYFFHYIALHLNFFMKIKWSWRDLFFHPSSHKNEIFCTVQVSAVTHPHVKGSTGGCDTDSLGQLPSLPSWDLESSSSVSLLLWHDNIINL